MRDEKVLDQLHKTSCACAAVRRAARAVTQFYDLVLAPTGLRTTQFITLRAIAEAGEIAQWQLAHQYAFAPETLSRHLSLARKKGLLQVRLGARRGERIYGLTPYGRDCLNKALPHWERAQQRLAQALGEDGLESAIDALDRIAQAAQAAERLRTPNVNGAGREHTSKKNAVSCAA
jgi:DNA-binding MarR family transcriptional regulator